MNFEKNSMEMVNNTADTITGKQSYRNKMKKKCLKKDRMYKKENK